MMRTVSWGVLGCAIALAGCSASDAGAGETQPTSPWEATVPASVDTVQTVETVAAKASASARQESYSAVPSEVPALVETCVAYIPVAAYLGRPEAAAMWKAAGDEAGLRTMCAELGRTDVAALETVAADKRALDEWFGSIPTTTWAPFTTWAGLPSTTAAP
jgi:hypothetical protein